MSKITYDTIVKVIKGLGEQYETLVRVRKEVETLDSLAEIKKSSKSP